MSVSGWTGIESLVFEAQMSKREALGLADPIVTNRFGVWGVASSLGAFLSACIVVRWMMIDTLLANDSVIPTLIALAGIVNSVGWALTFSPPNAYLKWVRRRAASRRERGAHDG